MLGGLRLPLYIAGAAQCAVALVIARPLARSLAASERAAAVADQVSAPSGTAVLALADGTHSDGGPPLTPSCDGEPATASLASQAVQASPKRRLHSRAGHGPLYWGRSSRNSRR